MFVYSGIQHLIFSLCFITMSSWLGKESLAHSLKLLFKYLLHLNFITHKFKRIASTLHLIITVDQQSSISIILGRTLFKSKIYKLSIVNLVFECWQSRSYLGLCCRLSSPRSASPPPARTGQSPSVDVHWDTNIICGLQSQPWLGQYYE